jgi:hypothetical protein
MTDHGWPRRRLLGFAAAAGGALVAPLAPSPASSPALASPAATDPTSAGSILDPTSAGGPNATLIWDRNAQTAIWDIAGQQPNEQVRSFAMVSGAVYDAVNAAAGAPYQP